MIKFLVQGSSETPYTVTFTLDGSNLNVICTCRAGENRSSCKHWMSILSGDVGGVVSANKDDIVIVMDWLHGSALELAFNNFKDAEHVSDVANKRKSQAKRALNRAMRQ
ncbi:hypothetical protein MMIC_P0516 [Mariprofundus micogutta]|uniref:SWIM-type domain-containing protein n=1 Tax=Mariprofundus micogutta TaxID=1921010 RepID=A0A1L8CL48_9PROT|nr:hypothetical protein [Mariprofundus micogutta]GAV19569.1 hypothetical protein MMIC_P0516 [Mariprofundus micogutta]